MNINKIAKAIDEKLPFVAYNLIQSFFLLQILIFTTEFFYPARIRATQEHYFLDSSKFHNGMMRIFVFYSVILFITAIVLHIKKKDSQKYLPLTLGIFTGLFSYFSVRGYTWYFYGSTKFTSFFDHLSNALSVVIPYSLLFLLFLAYKNKNKFRLKIRRRIVAAYSFLVGSTYILFSVLVIVVMVRQIFEILLNGLPVHKSGDWSVEIAFNTVFVLWTALTTYLLSKVKTKKGKRIKTSLFFVPAIFLMIWLLYLTATA